MAYSVRVQFTVAGEAGWQVTPRQQGTESRGCLPSLGVPHSPAILEPQELVPSTFRAGFLEKPSLACTKTSSQMPYGDK